MKQVCLLQDTTQAVNILDVAAYCIENQLGKILTDKSKISEEERALFRDSVKGSRRLKHDKVTPPAKRTRAYPAQTIRDEQQVLEDSLSDLPDDFDVEMGDELLYARNGVQNSVIKKLRRGMFRIEAELDLHRLTRVEARNELIAFLQACQQQGIRCIRIIHGKGLGSKDKIPVLKANVDHWLRQRDDVLAFCSARRCDGGTGAVYVLLRRDRDLK